MWLVTWGPVGVAGGLIEESRGAEEELEGSEQDGRSFSITVETKVLIVKLKLNLSLNQTDLDF